VIRLRPRADLLLVVACLGLYVGAAAQVRTQRGTALSVAVLTVSEPPIRLANAIGTLVATVWAGERALSATLVEMGQMRTELGSLRRSNQLLTAEVATLRQGSRLLASFPALAERSVLARVVARDALVTHTLRLDKGREDGVKIDSPVLSEDGLVGRIDRLAARNCRVQLLSHPQAAAAARIPGVPQEALLVGGDAPKLTGLPPYTEIPPDSPVVSSGSEGIYPPGLLLGTALEPRTEGLFTVVPIRLAAAPAEVMVVMILDPGEKGAL
jgi:rod shape-determining protein MreC